MIKKILGILIALLIVGAVFSAIYLRVAVIKPALECIRTELIDPYILLQDQGNIEGAYYHYTTEEFRREHALEDMRNWHDDLGKRLSYEMLRDYSPLLETSNATYQLHYRMDYKDDSKLMAFEIVPTGDGYRINGAYTESRPGNMVSSPW